MENDRTYVQLVGRGERQPEPEQDYEVAIRVKIRAKSKNIAEAVANHAARVMASKEFDRMEIIEVERPVRVGE